MRRSQIVNLGGDMSLDPDLIAAQWGLVTAFGVAVTLLAQKADQYYQEYVRSGSDRDRKNADKWVKLVRSTPVAVLVAVIVLTAVAEPALPLRGTEVRQEYSILILPVLAQIGFIYVLWKLVPSLSAIRAVRLESAKEPSDTPRKRSGSLQDTVIRVVNKSDTPLTLWWLDEDGTPVDNEGRRKVRINAGAERSVETKAGDWWLVRSKYGCDVGYFQSEDEPVKGEVDQWTIDDLDPPQIVKLQPLSATLPPSQLIGGKAAITVFNKSDIPLTLTWVDYGSAIREKFAQQIPPGREHTEWTWAGHYWLVRTQSGTYVGLIQAKLKPTKTEVDQELTAPEMVRLQPASGTLPASQLMGGQTAITVFNKSNVPLTLTWVDKNSAIREKYTQLIPPGREHTEEGTWVGHYWLVRTQSGTYVGLIQAMVKPTKTEVDQATVSEALLSSQAGARANPS
jgi:hypothetical protein